MKRYLAALLLILTAPTATAADAWDSVDFALLTTATAALVVDWSQTRWIVRNRYAYYPAYYETNPLLGENPTTGEVDTHFAVSLIGTAVIAHVLPSTWRKAWLGTVTALEVGFTAHNYQLGIRTEW